MISLMCANSILMFSKIELTDFSLVRGLNRIESWLAFVLVVGRKLFDYIAENHLVDFARAYE